MAFETMEKGLEHEEVRHTHTHTMKVANVKVNQSNLTKARDYKQIP